MDIPEMPKRAACDGPISVTHPIDGNVSIAVTHDGQEQTITMSEYNAWRVFGLMSIMLKLPLSKTVGKAIRLGDGPVKASCVPVPKAGKTLTLGDRVAHHLTMDRTVEELQRRGIRVEKDVDSDPSAPAARDSSDDTKGGDRG